MMSANVIVTHEKPTLVGGVDRETLGEQLSEDLGGTTNARFQQDPAGKKHITDSVILQEKLATQLIVTHVRSQASISITSTKISHSISIRCRPELSGLQSYHRHLQPGPTRPHVDPITRCEDELVFIGLDFINTKFEGVKLIWTMNQTIRYRLRVV